MPSFSGLDPAIYFNANFVSPVGTPTDVVIVWTDPFGRTVTQKLTLTVGWGGVYFWLTTSSYFPSSKWNAGIFLADGTELADQPFTVG